MIFSRKQKKWLMNADWRMFLKTAGQCLDAIIGTLANEGIDKLTILSSSQIKYFGAWFEQLIAESTGKDGKGILPVDLEPMSSIENFSHDRVFVHLKLEGDSSNDEIINAINEKDFPFIEITFNDVYDLAGEYFRWEFATAIAGYVLAVQPFDQPNVESAKIAAKEMMNQFSESGNLPKLKPTLTEGNIKIIGDVESSHIKDVLSEFLSSSVKDKNYVALQAYLKPEEKTWQALQDLRFKILSKYKIATTLGYGPRFLHSTGQLHKGDAGNGLFIQIVDAWFRRSSYSVKCR